MKPESNTFIPFHPFGNWHSTYKATMVRNHMFARDVGKYLDGRETTWGSPTHGATHTSKKTCVCTAHGKCFRWQNTLNKHRKTDYYYRLIKKHLGPHTCTHRQLLFFFSPLLRISLSVIATVIIVNMKIKILKSSRIVQKPRGTRNWERLPSYDRSLTDGHPAEVSYRFRL